MLTAALFTSLVSLTAAHGPTHSTPLQVRENRLANFVEQGITTGRLTRSELHRLALEKRKYERKRAKALRDGVLTAKELRKLHRMLDRAAVLAQRLVDNRIVRFVAAYRTPRRHVILPAKPVRVIVSKPMRPWSV